MLILSRRITLVPVRTGRFIARMVMKMNFVRPCGLLAGSTTSRPALSFAISTAGSDAPAVSYAMVYPVTMILRILVAQLLVLLFAGG